MNEPYEAREAARVEIVDFRPEYADAFRQMNLDWINHYWEVEDSLLESNTILDPAINLYRKLGFEPVQGGVSPYDRCNIQMEMWLT